MKAVVFHKVGDIRLDDVPEPKIKDQYDAIIQLTASAIHPDDEKWQPGNAPSQVLDWAIEALAKAGTLSIVGVYPAAMKSFRIGDAMEKNLTIRMGNCNHRKYIPELVRLVKQGSIEPRKILTQIEPLMSARVVADSRLGLVEPSHFGQRSSLMACRSMVPGLGAKIETPSFERARPGGY